MQHTLQRQERGAGGERGPNTPQPSPLWDIKLCMLMQMPKQQRTQTPLHITPQHLRRPAGDASHTGHSGYTLLCR